MNLFLRRYQTARCTLGILYASGEPWELFTLERPWQENAPRISCVPDGVYSLEPHNGTRWKDTWALVGQTVSHFPGEGKPRSACVFHPANLPSELMGCIAVGIGAFVHDPQGFTLVDSRAGMDRLRKSLVKHDGNTLTIIGGKT